MKTRAVHIGNIIMGGDHPVIVQSMANTDTNNIEASVAQAMRIIETGGQMVRFTTQGLREVESLKLIREELKARGFYAPLVADVHFSSKVAMKAASVVEKVRINPGNYMDRNYHGPLSYDPEEQRIYQDKIRERLLPLIQICQQHNTAIRIGVNHGSLSRRILNWYGDTPEGMVVSALEFIRIFSGENFHNLVISLKASNSKIMVMANRMLARAMQEEELAYPIHLGVTEAGSEDEARIKSAAGIGCLLQEGIGNTVRVSLTEDPEYEIPVAQKIIHYFSLTGDKEAVIPEQYNRLNTKRFFESEKSPSIAGIGGIQPPAVVIGLRRPGLDFPVKDFSPDQMIKAMSDLGFEVKDEYSPDKTPLTSDFIFTDQSEIRDALMEMPGVFLKEYPFQGGKNNNYFFRISEPEIELLNKPEVPQPVFYKLKSEWENPDFSPDKLRNSGTVIILELPGQQSVKFGRRFMAFMRKHQLENPVIFYRKYHSKTMEDLLIQSSGEFGSLFIDEFGEGIWIEDLNTEISSDKLRKISFGILQAVGARISETEYIACPSCGRTLFDIQKTLKKVKEATKGLRGLKIAVMGCIVNGPGEMADADYGYVGAGPKRVSLYRKNEAVRKNISEEKAVEELVKLIRKDRKA